MNSATLCFAISLLVPFGAAAQQPIRDFSIDVIEELASLLHRKPIYVATGDETLWAVEGDRIRQVDPSQFR